MGFLRVLQIIKIVNRFIMKKIIETRLISIVSKPIIIVVVVVVIVKKKVWSKKFWLKNIHV